VRRFEEQNGDFEARIQPAVQRGRLMEAFVIARMLPKRDFKYVIGVAKRSPTSELPRRWQSVRAALHATFSLRSAAESVPGHDAKRGCRAESAVSPLR